MSWLTESTAMPHPKSSGLLFSVRHFLYVVEGRPFSIDVMESTSGHLTAHAESTSDPHEAIHPQSATNLEDVLKAITLEIDAKVCKW
ncbi:MAG: hypothetical protein RI953_2444 [Pseudomonadota bacterium]